MAPGPPSPTVEAEAPGRGVAAGASASTIGEIEGAFLGQTIKNNPSF